MSAHIKVELFDLGPHNGMCEPDPKGSYHAFTLTEIGDKGDEPQWSSFMVPAHQLPVRTDLCAPQDALRAKLAVARIEALTAERDALRSKLDVAEREALNASLFAAELAESIGPSDEWSHDFKEGYVFGGRDAARLIRQKCTFPDAALRDLEQGER